MQLGEKKVIDGHTYQLIGQHLTKADADRKAQHMRRGQFSARLEKVSRGDYRVWSR